MDPPTLSILFLLIAGYMPLTTATDIIVSDLAHSNAEFGFRLYKKLSEQEDAENLFFSPYSISTAMAMCYLGSRGETRTEMAEVMGFSNSFSIKASFQDLINNLFAPNEDYILKSANKFYAQDGWDFESDFKADLLEYYKAGTELVDFAHNSGPTRNMINEWVERQTENTIKELFPEGSIDSSTILVLVNALYFKADWHTKFDPMQTMSDDFKLLDSSTVSVPMMRLTANLNMVRDDAGTFKMVEIPYTGKTLAMYIVLPEQVDGLRTVEESLDADTLTLLIARMRERKTDLLMPKFKVTQQIQLPAILKALGLAKAFSPDLADFTGISKTDGLFISEVVHQAYISIDEEGTEASAATGVSISRMSAQYKENFRVDHPFIVVIRDKATGSNLFMGRIVNPETTTRPLSLRFMRSVGAPPQEGAVIGDNSGGRPGAKYGAVLVIVAMLMVLV